jgi:acyl carrier protein
MDQNQYEELKAILKPYVQNEKAFENLTNDTHFIEDLEINSANLVDVVLDVEDKYDIEIDNDSMEKMLTINDALTIITEKQKS